MHEKFTLRTGLQSAGESAGQRHKALAGRGTLLRQFFLQIPRELSEAARIDGATLWQAFLYVALPLDGVDRTMHEMALIIVLVGTLVGMTGLGGGVLMLPLLIFGLGVPPIVAAYLFMLGGTDEWARFFPPADACEAFGLAFGAPS